MIFVVGGERRAMGVDGGGEQRCVLVDEINFFSSLNDHLRRCYVGARSIFIFTIFLRALLVPLTASDVYAGVAGRKPPCVALMYAIQYARGRNKHHASHSKYWVHVTSQSLDSSMDHNKRFTARQAS